MCMKRDIQLESVGGISEHNATYGRVRANDIPRPGASSSLIPVSHMPWRRLY
jgi:hypothetical protein